MWKEKDSCRLCGGLFEEVLDLGLIYPSEFIDELAGQVKVPLTLVKCLDCDLVQSKYTVNQDKLYRQYWYRSGLNNSMVEALRDIVLRIEQKAALRPGNVLVDIGCNDGTLFNLYSHREARVMVGFDPAKNLADEAKASSDYFINDYFTADLYKQLELPKAKVITTIAMFYDLDDPHSFVADIVDILDEDGIWVIQMTDLISMLHTNAFDNICLAENELITTSKGNVSISNIEVGDSVLTHRGRFKKVLKVFKSAAPKTLINLQAYGMGHAVQVTENHPIMVKEDSQWLYKPAKDINIGDVVGRPVIEDQLIPPQDFPITDLIGKIIGYYLSEGSYNLTKKNGNVVNFYFNKNEESTYVVDLVNALEKSGFVARKYQSRTSCYVTTNGIIAKWLYVNFGHLAHKKKIPMWVYGLDKNVRKLIFISYMNGDGYKYRNDKYFRANTVSEDLAYGISLLANTVGYKASISKQKRPQTGIIEGRVVNQRPLWDILVHLIPTLKQKVWLEDGIQCARIKTKTIVPYSSNYVYNLEIEDDNTFVTPSMAVHNCHEHLAYYSLNVLNGLLCSHGLNIFDVEYNQVNGGSVRIYINKDLITAPSVAFSEALDAEFEFLKQFEDPFEAFRERVEDIKRVVVGYIVDEVANGKTIAVMGASTKGNTLLQYFGLDDAVISHAAEINKDKFGKLTVGTNIPIIDEQYSLALQPDYYLVLPWHFIGNFIEKNIDYLKGGGQFIVPMPNPAVLSYCEAPAIRSDPLL